MRLPLVLPKVLEPARRQRRVTGRILDIAVPQVRLEGSRIDPVVGQFEAARVPQHVGVRLDPELGDDGGPFDHAIKPWRRQRRSALGHKDKRRRQAFALVPPELTHFPASQGMRRRRAAFEAVDVHLASVEVDLLPFQVRHFRGPQPVPVRHQDHERISTAVPVVPRRLDQALDLLRPQMLSLAQILVFGPDRRLRFSNCPVFGGWRDQPKIRLCHDNSAPGDQHSPIYAQKWDGASQAQSATP